MDAFLIGLGAVVTKWILRSWSHEDAFGDSSADFVDLLPQRVGDFMVRRRVARELGDIADHVASRIGDYLKAETPSADSAEVSAAVQAVSGSLDKALISSQRILDVDVDISAIETYVRTNDGDATRQAGLSDAGSAAYDTILSECVKYIVSVVVRLPSFRAAESKELLTRQTALRVLVEEVLASLPSSSVPAVWGRGNPHRAFENKYRTVIFNFSDRMRLFGVSSQAGSSAYSLSVAYISLAVENHGATAKSVRKLRDQELHGSTLKAADTTRRVEAALGNSNQVLIAGDAGSGKTTLLQWIACKAAQSSFDQEMEDWNGLIPFFVPLRRYVGSPLPQPEDFLAATAASLVGAMPQGWVHAVLADGRGIVLVDGVDELPEVQRIEVKTWLESLVSAFPANKFVLTSRSTAIERSWADMPEFSKVALLPMEPADIESFIDHWYEAASGDRSDQTKIELDASRKSLLRAIRERSAIRSLCTSPLLCALVCALNSERQSHLPENRMDLYKVALEMLIERRDNERSIAASPAPEINYREAEILLRSFAAWMHENGRSDAGMSDLTDRVRRQLPSMHNVLATPEEVAKHLMVRTGLLREPVAGRVDFVHRTFLEYLAAAEIVDDNSVEKLIVHAHEDYWREVVILAAGHASKTARTALLRGLIGRGDEEPTHQHRLYLLALACMETSPYIDPDTQSELERCLVQVIPPRNMTDAAGVASAGLLAVPKLADKHGEIATVAAACVRALSLIGGQEALAALEPFGRDPRLTVIRQLIRGWSAFDPGEYAEKILADSHLEDGGLTVSDPALLPHLHKLRGLRSARLELSYRLKDLTSIPPLKAVHSVDLQSINHLHDLRSFTSVRALVELEKLTFRGCRDLKSLRGLEGSKISHLELLSCHDLEEIDALASVSGLRSLRITHSALNDLSPLEDVELDSLRLIGNDRLSSFGSLINTRELVMATDSLGGDGLNALSRSTRLRQLHLYSYVEADFGGISLPDGLETLNLSRTSISNLTGANNLNHILFEQFLDDSLRTFIEARKSIQLVEWTHFDFEDPDQEVLESIFALKTSADIEITHYGADLDLTVDGFETIAGSYSTRFVRL